MVQIKFPEAEQKTCVLNVWKGTSVHISACRAKKVNPNCYTMTSWQIEPEIQWHQRESAFWITPPGSSFRLWPKMSVPECCSRTFLPYYRVVLGQERVWGLMALGYSFAWHRLILKLQLPTTPPHAKRFFLRKNTPSVDGHHSLNRLEDEDVWQYGHADQMITVFLVGEWGWGGGLLNSNIFVWPLFSNIYNNCT